MTTSKQDPESVRARVSADYTEALQRSEATKRAGEASSGCCGSAPANSAVGLVGYEEGLDDSLAAVAESSFGCGNPLAFAGVEAGQTVLDLGSGAGLDLLIAAQHVGPTGRVIGVDMTDAMIETARANAAKAGATQVEVRKGIIEQLPIEDASVDWVISNCVINLSPDKPAVFREIARVLRPGGRFSISDIVVDELPPELREHAIAYSACIGGAISETDYLAGLREAGFDEVEVTERVVYTAAQLEEILDCGVAATACGSDTTLQSALPAVAGKVWSAKIVGRRTG